MASTKKRLEAIAAYQSQPTPEWMVEDLVFRYTQAQGESVNCDAIAFLLSAQN